VKLVQLKLRNFRQHENSDIPFESGMTAIVGANGTGKSTILEAISFALYGEQRDTRDTLRFYWAEERGMSVSLEFEIENRRFIVERRAQDASLKELSPQEKVWAAGLRPVGEACERLLNLNYEQFKNSFCAEQKGLAFLQFSNKRARQEEVARMLGFHRLKAAEDLAGQRRQTLGGQISTLEATVGDPQEAEATRKAAKILHQTTEKELAEAAKLAESLAQKLGPSEESFLRAREWNRLTTQMREIGGKAEGLKESVRLTKAELEAAEADVKSLAEAEPGEAEYQAATKRIQEIAKLAEAERARAAMEAERVRLVADAEKLRQEARSLGVPDVDALRAQVEKSTQELAAAAQAVKEQNDAWQAAKLSVQGSVSEAQAHFSLAQVALDRAVQAFEQGVCGECGQPTGPGYSEVVDQRRREQFETQTLLDRALRAAQSQTVRPGALAVAEQFQRDSEARLKEAKAALESAERLSLQAGQLEKQAQERAAKAEQIKAELEGHVTAFDPAEQAALEARLLELQPFHETALRLKDSGARLEQRKNAYEKAKQDLESARDQYRTLDAERKGLGIEGQEVAEEWIAAHNLLLQQLQGANADLKGKKELLEVAATNLKAATERLAEVRQRQKDLKALRQSYDLHDTTVKEMRKLRLSLNASIGPELSARASENLSLLTNGRYDTLRLDADFSAELVEDGVAKAVISGGEEDVVALALRLALSELIQERQGRPMSLLILDEVFGSLDTDRRQAVLDRLTSLKGRFQQILVISHIEEINQVADQCLYLDRDPVRRSTRVTDAPFSIIEELG
jgi:exonuclease SbcC